MKKKILAVCLMVSLCVGVTACSGGTKGGGQDGKTGDQSKAENSQTVKSQAGRNDLKIAVSGEPVRFFPCGPDGSNNSDLIVLNNCYDPLISMNADGTLAPCLADSWEISEDGLVYTFHLKEGVKFHDGSAMTAEDVVFTFDLSSQNTTGKALIINYDHSQVIDEKTVAVHLTEPFAPFLNGIASRAAYIISKAHYEAVGADGYLEQPIGTGAYKFVSALRGDTVTLEAFEDYFGGAAPIKKVEIKIMTDTTTQTIALESGDVDAILSPSISSCIKLDEGAGVTWDSSPSAGRVSMLLSENNGQPGKDKNFRKAVQSAINKSDIIEGATEGYAAQLDIDICPAYSAVPQGYQTVAYDVEKAKEYLAASGYNQEPFEIIVQSGTEIETAAQIIQAQLMEAGINCTINAVDTATFNDLWYAGKFGAMIRETTSSLMDADGISNFYMGVPYAPTDNNQFGRTKELYDICMEARKTQGDARKDLYLKVVDIVTEEAYQIPLYASPGTMAYSSSLNGIKVHPLKLVQFHGWSWK